MSFLNPDFDKLPERVQAVLDGGSCGADGPCCTMCRSKGEQFLPSSDETTTTRMLRCSRCLVAHYCSRNCQLEHFEFHKRPCKSIHQKRTQLEQAQEQIRAIGGEPEEPEDASHQTLYAMTAALMMNLGDDLVVMGYRETDTIANGALYYRQALHYYFGMMKLLRGTFFDERSPMDDKVLMLLVVLGGDSKVIMQWCMRSGSRRYANFFPVMEEGDAPPEFQTQGLAGNDLLFQALSMLVSMRSLAEYRRNLRAFEAYKQRMQELTTNTSEEESKQFQPLYEDKICSLIYPNLMGPTQEGEIHMDILPDEIRLIISAIRHHGHGSFLRHLRDDIPLSPEHAPTLLRGSGVTSNGDEVNGNGGGGGATTLPEFWHLYQDCFFLTPGLNDVLNEFLPEDQDDDDEDA